MIWTHSIQPLKRPLISLSRTAEDHIRAVAERLKESQELVVLGDLPVAKWEFLTYLCDHLGFLAHGSDRQDLTELIPVDRDRGDLTEFGNAAQLFATPDALWAMWFAVLNRQTERKWGTCNSCVRHADDQGKIYKTYWFAVPHDIILHENPLAPGSLYILRPDTFLDKNGEEWGSKQAVQPLARIDIEPADWPYHEAILGYDRRSLGDRLEQSADGFPWFDDEKLWPIVPQIYRSKWTD